jgi:hypothetical protein
VGKRKMLAGNRSSREKKMGILYIKVQKGENLGNFISWGSAPSSRGK